jgi:hypothetical protein
MRQVYCLVFEKHIQHSRRSQACFGKYLRCKISRRNALGSLINPSPLGLIQQPWHKGLDFDRANFVATSAEGEDGVQRKIDDLRSQVVEVRYQWIYEQTVYLKLPLTCFSRWPLDA